MQKMIKKPVKGVDMFHYAIAAEDGTFGKPKPFEGIISANAAVQNNEAKLYADNRLWTMEREFKDGSLSVGVVDITPDINSDLLGTKLDKYGGVVSTTADNAPYVAVGFRAAKSDGGYKYVWYYKVKFGVPSTNYATKGENISYQTPALEGLLAASDKEDSLGRHIWKYELDSDNMTADSSILDDWFENVYFPEYSPGA